MLPRAERLATTRGSTVKPYIPIDRTMVLLSFAFAAAWTVTSAMAAHLPRIVEAFGATPAQAVVAGIMIGPAQVAARVMEASVLGRFHPLVSTRLACITAAIGLFGGRAAAAFALLHGAGNGILTIARGTLPLAIFGPENYAYRLGLIGAPSRIAQALAPLAIGLLIEPLGRGIVLVSAGLSLSALIALMLLGRERRQRKFTLPRVKRKSSPCTLEDPSFYILGLFWRRHSRRRVLSLLENQRLRCRAALGAEAPPAQSEAGQLRDIAGHGIAHRHRRVGSSLRQEPQGALDRETRLPGAHP